MTMPLAMRPWTTLGLVASIGAGLQKRENCVLVYVNAVGLARGEAVVLCSFALLVLILCCALVPIALITDNSSIALLLSKLYALAPEYRRADQGVYCTCVRGGGGGGGGGGPYRKRGALCSSRALRDLKCMFSRTGFKCLWAQSGSVVFSS